jgi:cell fate regulator YaaT (PSP1 superfamily)
MEINSLKYDDRQFENQQRVVQETPTAPQRVQTEIQREQVKGSTSLQKELLSIINASQEEKAQRIAKEQIANGYLDVKI